jgi:nucleotide-binding universal stress UspA family protein
VYEKILVTLDATETDRAILEHIRPLAKRLGSRIVLLHVAEGWAARTYGSEAISPEITSDRAYLEKVRRELEADGIPAETHLAFGHPPEEIIKWVQNEHCDLIAMSTHGHRLLGDLLFGTTAHQVQHAVDVPVLLLRVKNI